MLADTEAKVASLGEVALPQLVLLDLETTLKDLLSLGAPDGNVDSDLFVTADTKGTDGVAGLACALLAMSWSPSHFYLNFSVALRWPVRRVQGRLTVDRSLTAQLLEHLRSTSKSVTRLADTDVEHELLDAQLAHGVGALVLSFRLHTKLAYIVGN